MITLIGKHCRDCKVLTDNIEPEALSIVCQFLEHPMFEGTKIRIMPDVHAGKDIVVGFTVPFSDHVNPDHVGGDIGCSVSTAITDLPVNPLHYADIERTIREKVCFGMTIHNEAVYDTNELLGHIERRLREARTLWPEMICAADVTEQGITAFVERVDQTEHQFYHSIGTVGGGNHFVEIGETPMHTYAFTIHCGSRNLGQKVWRYWHGQAEKVEGEARGYLTGEAMRGYLTDMVVAQAYAEFNHTVIGRLVCDAIRTASGGAVTIVDTIYTTHNYIDFSMKMLRKGAVAAPRGKRLVIPFNMRDGLIICRGKGNDDWNQSAPHGAGRLMSRSMAKEKVDLEEFKESMKDVYSTSVGMGTIDESPMAYKEPTEILRLIEDTVEVECFIRPVINLKAASRA